MQIDHINIKAPPALLAKVRQFYRDVFGLEEGPRPQFSSRGHWLYSSAGAIVHLSESAGAAMTGARGHLDHVAFRTSGLALFVARLEALNVPFEQNYVPELELTQLFFSDPAGTGLEVGFARERRS